MSDSILLAGRAKRPRRTFFACLALTALLAAAALALPLAGLAAKPGGGTLVLESYSEITGDTPQGSETPGEAWDAEGQRRSGTDDTPETEEREPSGAEGVSAQPPAPPSAAQTSSAGQKQPAAPIRLFGTVEFRSPIKNLPKWERVRGSESKKPSFTAKGMDVTNQKVSQRWQNLKGKFKDATLAEKVREVNKFFNQWPYKTDREVWGVEDYWATPREFVQKSGDCEDYAISKYYALRDLGVPANLLRVAAIKDQIRNLGHAVLVVYMDNDAYVLDNLTNLVLSHKKLTHYAPQYSVNEEFLWRHVKPKATPGAKKK